MLIGLSHHGNGTLYVKANIHQATLLLASVASWWQQCCPMQGRTQKKVKASSSGLKNYKAGGLV